MHPEMRARRPSPDGFLRHIAQVVVPPVQDVEEYNPIVGPLLNRILCNCRESQSLTQLRDALLPKLISGEIRVPEAEHALKEVL